MTETNPFKLEPKPVTEHVVTITHEALSEWQQKVKFPYPMAGADGIVEVRARELFYIQQIVRKLLQDNSEQIDSFLQEKLND